jgi:Fe-S cluster assembly protein SufD
MKGKFLKYGIGILTPAAPAGTDFDSARVVRPVVESAHPEILILSSDDAAAPKTTFETAQAADPVFRWHDAAAKTGTVVIVPPGFRAEKPIRLTFPSGEGVVASNVTVIVGADAAVRVIESADPVSWAHPPAFVRSARVDLVLGDRASVEYLSVQDLASGASDFIRRRARLGADAALKWTDFCFGSGFTRSAVSTRLEGEGAAVESRSIYFAIGGQQFDFDQEVLHLAPHTRSDLKTRGALKDKAKAIVRGLVRIPKGSSGCSGFQREDALLLSDGCEASAVPKLEIADDDVKCGHAASTGRVDEEKLFYLMSRGLDRKTAVAAVVEGFFAPVIAEAGDAILEESLARAVSGRLED